MKLYLIKNMPYQGRILKAGKWVDLWDAADARKAIADGYAVPYNERNLKKDESFAETKATPESAGVQTKETTAKAKTKTKKNN